MFLLLAQACDNSNPVVHAGGEPCCFYILSPHLSHVQTEECVFT